jgi:hypothetical protein
VLLWTVRNIFGEGVNRLGSIGSSVMVERKVAVNAGTGVSVIRGNPVGGVFVAGEVLMTNRSGVLEAGNENGVAVGAGELVTVGVWRKGIEIGSEEQPERMETKIAM